MKIIVLYSRLTLVSLSDPNFGSGGVLHSVPGIQTVSLKLGFILKNGEKRSSLYAVPIDGSTENLYDH